MNSLTIARVITGRAHAFFVGDVAANRSFRAFWLGQAISQAGSAISLTVLPLIAVLVVKATPAQMGLLVALEFIPALLFTLPTGILGDRADRRRILIAADLGRMVAVGMVPLAYALGRLDFTVLAAVAFVMGSLGIVFSVTYEGFMTEVVADDGQLVGGYQRLEVSSSAAQIAGPGLGGLLFGLIGAGLTVLLDAVSYLVSAVSLLATRRRRAAEKADGPVSFRSEFLAGFAIIGRDRVLRDLAVSTGLMNVGSGFLIALFVVWATRELGMSAAAYGIMYSVTSLGFIFGSSAASVLSEKLGGGRTLILAAAMACLSMLLVPLASPGAGLAFLFAARLLVTVALMAYNIILMSLRQQRADPAFRSRITGSFRFISWGALPIGSLIGGAIAEQFDIRVALWLAFIIPTVGLALLAAGPVRNLRVATVAHLGSALD